MKKPALGKGLSALIPITVPAAPDEPFQLIDMDKLVPNVMQPRKFFEEEKLSELAASMRSKGLLQPILVRPNKDKFEIIAGERRFRAAKKMGWTSLAAVILENFNNRDVLELSIIENLQRDDLNPLELAQGFERLIAEFSFTQEDLATRLGKNRSSIANTLRLLKLPEEIKEKILLGKLKEGHARAILALATEKEQLELAKRILEEDLSVRAIEEIIYGPKRRKRGRSLKLRSRPIEIAAAETALKQKFGTAVVIQRGLKKGKITIQFYGDDDLTRILDLLGVVV